MSKKFHIQSRGSSIVQELRSGFVTFLTLSYILLVNGQMLSLAGIPAADSVMATALASAIGCFISGWGGNLPFGLAPGLGLSAYLTYGLVVPEVLTKQQALTTCLVAGIMMGLFAVTGISALIMSIIPRSIKLGTVVGMGLQIALIGIKASGLVVLKESSLLVLGDLEDYRIWVTLFGVVLTASLMYHQVRGSILLGIVVLTVLCWWLEESWPETFFMWPTMTTPLSENISFESLAQPLDAVCSAVAAFLCIGIFDVSGIIFGMSSLAGLMQEDGSTPGSTWGFVASSIGTVIAAPLGCTPIIIGVETAAGIKEGARTGLSALVTGVFFALSLFLAPLFGEVPQVATAPILILIGTMMMGESRNIDWEDIMEAIPAFVTATLMPFTFSISNGIWFGLGTALVLFFSTGTVCGYLPKWRERPGSIYEVDDQAMVRHPSLLLPKDEVDRMSGASRPSASKPIHAALVR